MTEQINGDNGASCWGDCAFHRCRIEAEEGRFDVGEDWNASIEKRCDSRRAHRVGRDDHLVTWFHADRPHRSDQTGGRGVHRHRMLDTEMSLPFSFECDDFRTAEETWARA